MKKLKPNKNLILLLISCSIAFSGCLNYQNRWTTGGLGITLAEVEDGIVIKEIAPTFNSEEAALLTGDYVIIVDGVNVAQMPKEAILDAISGPVGSNVTITVLREGRPVTLEIERILLKNTAKKTLYSVRRPESAQPDIGNSSDADKTSLSEKDTGDHSNSSMPSSVPTETPEQLNATEIDDAVDADSDSTDADESNETEADTSTTDGPTSKLPQHDAPVLDA